MTPEGFSAAAAKRRIELWIAIAGVLGAAGAWFFEGAYAAGGVALGAGLAGINFRWLKQGLGAFEQISREQAGKQKVRIPKTVLLRFFARTALILVVLYASLAYSLLPAWALLAGLFTPVAAVIAESVYQVTSRMGESG
jgi:hypothetical protein